MMKKLDIEKLERKETTLPENFFQEMQEKVLEKTVRKEKKTDIFRLDFVWYAAAIVLLAGLGFLYLSQENQTNAPSIAQKPIKTEISPDNTPSEKDTKTQSIALKKEIYTDYDASFASENIAPYDSSDTIQKVTPLKIEEVLDAMPDKELKDLAINYEQDSYLELY